MKTLLLSLSFILAATFAGAAEYELKLHHFYSPNEPAQTKMLEPWARNVEKLSNGKVKILIVPGMRLGGSPADLADQAKKGRIADLVWSVNGVSGKDFLRTEVF